MFGCVLFKLQRQAILAIKHVPPYAEHSVKKVGGWLNTSNEAGFPVIL